MPFPDYYYMYFIYIWSSLDHQSLTLSGYSVESGYRYLPNDIHILDLHVRKCVTDISIKIILQSLLRSELLHTSFHCVSPTMLPIVVITSCLLALLIRFLLRSVKHNPRHPPSPTKLPIIGNLHQLGPLPHRSLASLSQKHGPLMLLHFGSVPNLVVSSEELAREVFKTHDLIFSDRPTSIITDLLSYQGKDVAFSPYGEYWRQVRKISVVHLLSPTRVESFQTVREEEVRLMINDISSTSSEPINIGERIISTTNNIISRVSFGKRYYQEQGSETGFPQLLAELSALVGTVHIGDIFPSFAWVGELTGLNARLRKSFHEWDEFLEKAIEEHLDPKRVDIACGGTQGLVDILFDIQKKGEYGFTLDKDGIKAILMDNFVAGTETIYNTTEWTMAELMRHPRVLNRVQQEIREVVNGRDGVREDDIKQMDYLKSVVKETFRLHPPGPLLVPRLCRQEVELLGYSIPAKTRVMVNAWAIGRDPKLWECPEEFLPERFMENNAVDFRGQHFQLIPFGAGRRICPGIHYGIATIELVLVNLLYWFDWRLPYGVGEELDMSEASGIAVRKKSPLVLIAKKHFH